MVKTDTSEEVSMCGTDRCLDGIDINNSCRRVYLRRMESIKECKRSPLTDDVEKQSTSIGAALARLRMEMVGLMDQDAGLMRQMLILNEKVEELKANNICQMSKESLDSQDSVYNSVESDDVLSDDSSLNYSETFKKFNNSAYFDNTCNEITHEQNNQCPSEQSNDLKLIDDCFRQIVGV